MEGEKQITKPLGPTIYTEEFVIGEVDDIFRAITEDQSILYLGEAIIPKPYCRQRFSEWAKDFSDNERISDTIKKIKEILEMRLARGATVDIFNAPFVWKMLKANYGYKDEQTINLADIVPKENRDAAVNAALATQGESDG